MFALLFNVWQDDFVLHYFNKIWIEGCMQTTNDFRSCSRQQLGIISIGVRMSKDGTLLCHLRCMLVRCFDSDLQPAMLLILSAIHETDTGIPHKEESMMKPMVAFASITFRLTIFGWLPACSCASISSFNSDSERQRRGTHFTATASPVALSIALVTVPN